mmetsp:Transcript_24186/g.66195  ORF Transcript_24186/g.66195 Transcript_24186/m.66195 type:complete len:213 (+) Transcript_24186:678-1316(+)
MLLPRPHIASKDEAGLRWQVRPEGLEQLDGDVVALALAASKQAAQQDDIGTWTRGGLEGHDSRMQDLKQGKEPICCASELEHRRDEMLVPLQRIQAVQQHDVVRRKRNQVVHVHNPIQVKWELTHVHVHAAEPPVHGILLVAQEEEQVISGVRKNEVVCDLHRTQMRQPWVELNTHDAADFHQLLHTLADVVRPHQHLNMEANVLGRLDGRQ